MRKRKETGDCRDISFPLQHHSPRLMSFCLQEFHPRELTWRKTGFGQEKLHLLGHRGLQNCLEISVRREKLGLVSGIDLVHFAGKSALF